MSLSVNILRVASVSVSVLRVSSVNVSVSEGISVHVNVNVSGDRFENSCHYCPAVFSLMAFTSNHHSLH